jgi:hypothetical protein
VKNETTTTSRRSVGGEKSFINQPQRPLDAEKIAPRTRSRGGGWGPMRETTTTTATSCAMAPRGDQIAGKSSAGDAGATPEPGDRAQRAAHGIVEHRMRAKPGNLRFLPKPSPDSSVLSVVAGFPAILYCLPCCNLEAARAVEAYPGPSSTRFPVRVCGLSLEKGCG